jgi:hypothetical protein
MQSNVMMPRRRRLNHAARTRASFAVPWADAIRPVPPKAALRLRDTSERRKARTFLQVDSGAARRCQMGAIGRGFRRHRRHDDAAAIVTSRDFFYGLRRAA